MTTLSIRHGHLFAALAIGTTVACYSGSSARYTTTDGNITGIVTIATVDTADTTSAVTASPTGDVLTLEGPTVDSLTTYAMTDGTTTLLPEHSAGEASESGGSVRFDMSGPPDVSQPVMGCDKVDILFVIDNSSSMIQKQTHLLASFDGFIAAIQTVFADHSYHVGVVTSDNYGYNTAGCQTLGDLVSQTGGENSGWGLCTPFVEGHRFATEQDDLTAKFPCMAKVGTDGSPIEQPVTALIAALGPNKALPGGCNEGFLRADAILVVVIITDDPPYEPNLDDAHPSTDTSGWHAAVLAAKNNDPGAIVVIGFVPWGDLSCSGNKNPSPNLSGFVQSFEDQGILASFCDDFGPVFAESVATIVKTCEGFPTPG